MRVGMVTMLVVGAAACAEVLDLGALKEGDASTTDSSGDVSNADGGDAASCSVTIGSPSSFVAPGGQGTGIAVDDTNVYWTDSQGGRVLYCPKTGCSTALVAAASQVKPISVAVAGGMLYWTSLGNADNTGSVSVCSTSALPSCATKSIGAKNHPIAIAVNAHKVVWADEGSAGDSGANGSLNDGKIWSAGLDLSGALAFASSEYGPNGIAIDDSDNVYWVNSNDGDIVKYALSTSVRKKLTNTNEFPINITTDGTKIYWPTFFGGVYACDPNACSPTVIASSQDHPIGIATDCSGVYFSTDTKVATCPLTGCPAPTSPTIIGGTEQNPSSIALDSTTIYWVDYTDGTVRHASKQ